MATEFSGGGDPRRSLELLWGVQAPARRGPKARYTADDVVTAAIACADAEGIAALSMRRVAEALQVSPMSLYTYVPSKAELIDLMLDRVWGEALPPNISAAQWRQALTTMAHQDWALAQRHPWMLQVATHRPPLGPNIAARYEAAFRAIDGLGLSDIEIEQLIGMLENYVSGAVRTAVNAREVVEQTGITDHQWWENRHAMLQEMVSADRFPVASRVGAACNSFYRDHDDHAETFDFGLQRVLDGIAAFIDRAGRSPKSSLL